MTTTVFPGIIEQLSEEPGPILVWRACGAHLLRVPSPFGAPYSSCLCCYTSERAAEMAGRYCGAKVNPLQVTLESRLYDAKGRGHDWLLLVDEHWCVVDKWRVQ